MTESQAGPAWWIVILRVLWYPADARAVVVLILRVNKDVYDFTNENYHTKLSGCE